MSKMFVKCEGREEILLLAIMGVVLYHTNFGPDQIHGSFSLIIMHLKFYVPVHVP